jgi:hypothetical protein
MFYEEEQIRNVLNCEKCNNRLDEPKILPCGSTVCVQCISALKIINHKFECTMCEKSHSVPLDGFPTSKVIQNLLTVKPNEIPRTDSVRQLQTTLNEIQQKINQFAVGLESGIERIKEYSLNLRNEVLNCTKLKVQRIYEINDLFMREINQYEKECIEAFEKNKEDKEYFNRIIKETNIFQNDWNLQLKHFEISDSTFTQANQSGIKLMQMLDIEKLRLDDFVFDGNRLKFERNNSKITSNILGQFVSDRISINSSILNYQQIRDLMRSCSFSRLQRWKMIYRGSADGFSAQAFHSKCDGKRNTLTIIKSTSSNIFGGFAEEDWSGSQVYKNDPNSFIFSLINKEEKPIVMKCSDPAKAIFCSGDNGPVFGRRDLVVRSNSNSNNESYSMLGSSFKHPQYAFQSNEAKSFLAGSYKFQTVEIEVFMKDYSSVNSSNSTINSN